MLRFVLICCGGAFGTGARYLLSGWISKTSDSAFPYGTLSVNLIGSFVIALVVSIASRNASMSETTRLVLVTGVLGGFTTYSAFNQETLESLKQGAPGLALLIVSATVVGCLAAGLCGNWLGDVLLRGAT